MKDYYETLGVSRDATEAELKSAYRKLAMQYHPDRNPGDKASEEQFKKINEAYSCLSSSEKRANYDRFGTAEPGAGFGGGYGGYGGGYGADFSNVFEDLFGDLFGAFGARAAKRSARGSDLRYDLGISLFEAASGSDKVLGVQKWDLCSECSGTGSESRKPQTCPECNGRGQVHFTQGFFSISKSCTRCRGEGSVITDPCKGCGGKGRKRVARQVSVKIPPGVDTGTRLKMSGEGDPGVHGGPPGDLYIIIGVKEHEFFKRDGEDIYCQVPITFPEAALGAEIDVPTLSGSHKLKVPPGTQPGTAFQMKGKGMPRLGGRGKGNQVVVVNVAVPKNLSKRQKEIVEEFASISDEEVQEDFRSRVKSFFTG